jgi:hypothetical protein
MRRVWWIPVLAVLVTATATCTRDLVRPGPGAGPGVGPEAGLEAGELALTLVTPNSGADGALLLVVKGPAAITSVSLPPGSGLRLFASPPGADSIKVAITGTLTSGVLLHVGVADVNQAASYQAFVRQVAANNYTLRALTGYSTTVSR